MTDKEQIIIDGVDVSGCELYSKYREKYCEWHLPCQGQSCSYKLDWALKQLAHKTQECEELREDYEELEQRHNGAFQDFERLKQERRELEIKNVTLQNRYQQVAGATTEAGRYRKALEEIEEISVKNNITEFDFGSCTDLLKIIVNLAKDYGDILDIISKVKGKELL